MKRYRCFNVMVRSALVTPDAISMRGFNVSAAVSESEKISSFFVYMVDLLTTR
jgi:hypothetical protein